MILIPKIQKSTFRKVIDFQKLSESQIMFNTFQTKLYYYCLNIIINIFKN